MDELIDELQRVLKIVDFDKLKDSRYSTDKVKTIEEFLKFLEEFQDPIKEIKNKLIEMGFQDQYKSLEFDKKKLRVAINNSGVFIYKIDDHQNISIKFKTNLVTVEEVVEAIAYLEKVIDKHG